MTRFEQFLIDKGYIRHILNGKTRKFEVAEDRSLSTMASIHYYYFHNTDEKALQKIAEGKAKYAMLKGFDIHFDDDYCEIEDVNNHPHCGLGFLYEYGSVTMI